MTRLPALLLTASLLAACGGNDKDTDSVKAEDKKVTAAEAKAAADAINLTDADATGFKGTAHEDDPDSDAEEKEFTDCIGASSADGDLAQSYSKDYERGTAPQTQTVSSEVEVYSDEDALAADLKAYQAADKVTSCLTTSITKLLASEVGEAGVTFGKPVVTELATAAEGTDGGFGYLVKVTASAQGLEIPFEISQQGVLKDHTALSFSTMSIGEPFPAADRDALLAKLVDRLKDKAV